MLAAGGVVTPEARIAYEKLRRINPARVEPRFWLAMGKEQSGELAEALAEYKALLATAPPDAPYRPPLEMRVREVSAQIARAVCRRARWPDHCRHGRCVQA